MKKNICFLFVFCVCCNIFATTYFVSPSGNDNNSGLSWANAKLTIQSAIDSAQIDDSVFVAIGNFTGFTVKSGVHIYGGFLGFESYLYQRQPLKFGSLSNGMRTLITYMVSASTTGSYIVTNMDGFIIDVASEYAIKAIGMPILNINNCNIRNRLNSGYLTYGIYIEYQCMITNTKIADCYSTCRAIYFYPRYTKSKLIMRDCEVSNNRFPIYVYHEVSKSYDVIFERCLIANNKAIYNTSGDVYVVAPITIKVSGGNVDIIDCKIMNNSFSLSGTSTSVMSGGIYSIVKTRVINCIIANNTAIANNVNNDFAIGAVNLTNASSLIQNCTFANNSASHIDSTKAGIGRIGTTLLYNNIVYDTGSFWHNANYTFYNARKLKSLTGVGNIVLDTLNNGNDSSKNYVRFVRPTTFAGAATNTADSLAIFQADWHLDSGSACIDAGYPYYNTLAYQDSTDLDGNHRVSGGRVDMGAYEYPQADAPQHIVWNQNLQGHLSEGWLLSEAYVTSGLPLSYTSSNPGVATISGDTFVFHAVGKTTITATQWGDSVYMPATPLAKLLTVYGDTIFEQDTVKYYDTVWHNDTIWHHDTIRTQINDTVWYNDTIRTQVYDTLWHNDTLWVNDTLWYKDTLWYHDTTRTHIYDTIWHNDTTWYNDTIRTYINDTLWHNDTLWTRLYDTIPIYDTVTIYVYDTITVYDTVRVNIQDIDISVVPWQITQDGESIYVSGAEGESVRVYDVTGRCLHVEERAVGILRFRMYASGVYLVQIGNNPAQKVVLTR